MEFHPLIVRCFHKSRESLFDSVREHVFSLSFLKFGSTTISLSVVAFLSVHVLEMVTTAALTAKSFPDYEATGQKCFQCTNCAVDSGRDYSRHPMMISHLHLDNMNYRIYRIETNSRIDPLFWERNELIFSSFVFIDSLGDRNV